MLQYCKSRCIFAVLKIEQAMKTRLQELMKERGLTAKQLGERIGLKVGGVQAAVFRDLSSVSSAVRYAKGLHVPLWEMFYDCGASAIGCEQKEWQQMDEEIIPHRIVTILNERGMTQLDLARGVGMAQSGMSKLLKTGTMTSKTIDEICAFLNVKPHELFITPEALAAECNRRKALRGEPTTLTGEYKPAYSDTHPTPMQKMLNQGARLYFEMERRDKEAAQTPAHSMNDSEKEPDLFDTIADDAEEREMISVAESKRRMRKALQLLLDNLGRIRPETLDRIIEQACK